MEHGLRGTNCAYGKYQKAYHTCEDMSSRGFWHKELVSAEVQDSVRGHDYRT